MLQGRVRESFLYVLFLKSLQLEIFNMPRYHFWGWCVLNSANDQEEKNICSGESAAYDYLEYIHSFLFLLSKYNFSEKPECGHQRSKLPIVGECGWLSWLTKMTLGFGSGHDLRVMRSSPHEVAAYLTS